MILLSHSWIKINSIDVVDGTFVDLEVGDLVEVYSEIYITLGTISGPITDCGTPGTHTVIITNITTGAVISSTVDPSVPLNTLESIGSTFTVTTAGTYQFFRQGTFCENAEGWTEEDFVIIPAKLEVTVENTGCKTISITIETETTIRATITVTRVGDSEYENILLRDNDPNTSNSNIANVALPGNGVFLINVSASELEEDYCFIHHEFCDIQDCVRVLTKDIFCGQVDDCGCECPSDKLVFEQKRFALNKIMALFNQYMGAVKFEEFEYLTVTTVDNCRDLILTNIANLVTELDRAVAVCGDCDKIIDSTDCGCADTLGNTEQGEPFP